MSVYFIAEIGSSHDGSLDRALQLIDTAAEIGCNAVKFQLFRVDEMFAPEVLKAKPELLERKKYEVPLHWLPAIRKHCDDLGLEFGCTPCYLEAVDELKPFVDFFKVGSYELGWGDLHFRLHNDLADGFPVILSTGMATMEEVDNALLQLDDLPSLLHCVSQYPCRNPRLERIGQLREQFNVPVGWSDHSGSHDVVHDAVVNHGAELVEFHLALEAKGHRWSPRAAKALINNINPDWRERAWRRDSDGYRPMRWAR